MKNKFDDLDFSRMSETEFKLLLLQSGPLGGGRPNRARIKFSALDFDRSVGLKQSQKLRKSSRRSKREVMRLGE